MLKIGHRGAKGHEPENTFISFQKALDMQVDGIELDVHLSADGEIMVIHDESIDRTTNGKGFVNALSLRELKAFRINGEQQIPTLKEVFDLINQDCFINIELKSYEAINKVVSLIEKYVTKKGWKYDRFLISSFDWNALQQVAFLNDKIPIGVFNGNRFRLGFGFRQIHSGKIHSSAFSFIDKRKHGKNTGKRIAGFPLDHQ